MAYEFTLNHVGQDKDSSEIWIDYIQFIKSGEVCNFCYVDKPFKSIIAPGVAVNSQPHFHRLFISTCRLDFKTSPDLCLIEHQLNRLD